MDGIIDLGRGCPGRQNMVRGDLDWCIIFVLAVCNFIMVARCSKCDFRNLGIIWDRNRWSDFFCRTILRRKKSKTFGRTLFWDQNFSIFPDCSFPNFRIFRFFRIFRSKFPDFFKFFDFSQFFVSGFPDFSKFSDFSFPNFRIFPNFLIR